MMHWLRTCIWIFIFVVPKFCEAQLQIDTLLVLNNQRAASLLVQGDTIDWFTYRMEISGAQSPYFTYKLDSLGNVLSSSTFENHTNRRSFLRRTRIGNSYYTMRLNEGPDSLAFYQSSNDSTLGALAAAVVLPNWVFFNYFRQIGPDEIVASLLVEDISSGTGAVVRPMIVQYKPSTNNLALRPMFSRNGVPVFGWEAEVYGINRLSNNRRVVSCQNCKRFWLNGSWQFSSEGDLGFYDQDFQFISDTIPQYRAGTTSLTIQGPIQISAVEELSSGNIIFWERFISQEV